MHGDLFFELLRERGLDHPLTNLGAGLEQCIDIINVQAGQTGVDLFRETIVGEEGAIGFGRCGETSRHTHAGRGQLADHFTQRRIFAADLFHVGHAQFFEVFNKGVHKRSPLMKVKK